MEIINPTGKHTFSVSTDFCGRELRIEVNRVGFRTTSSVLVSYGDTTILGSVVVSENLLYKISSRSPSIMRKNITLLAKSQVQSLSNVKVSPPMKLFWLVA